MTGIEKLKKRILSLPEIQLGSDSFLLGTKAQQYDVKVAGFSGRKLFSFQVQTARITETARTASGRPSVREFQKSKIPLWFIGKKSESLYADRIGKYINLAERWRAIRVSGEIIEPTWTFETEVLDASGKYLKGVYSDRWLSLKKPQMEGLALVRQVLSGLPTLQDIDYEILGMTRDELTLKLSQLETMGALKVLRSGMIVPSIAAEIHGEKVEKVMDDSLNHPVSRYLFELIRKMPGIRLSKLLTHLGIALHDEGARHGVYKSLVEMREGNIIMLFLDNFGRDVHLVPVWVCYNVFRTSKPTVVDLHVLKQCFRVCSSFWDRVDEISMINKQVDTLRGILQELIRKRGFSMEELDELHPVYRIFISRLRLLGAVRRTPDGISVDKVNTSILDTILYILNSIYRLDISPSKTPIRLSEELIDELNSSLEEVYNVIADRLSLNDVKLYSGLE